MTHYAGTTFGFGVPPSYNQPIFPQAIAGYGIGQSQPWHQIIQLLQTVPQQLQQLQLVQQQQVLQLQLLLHTVPAQLQQLQQLLQVAAQQIPHLQQPFGSAISSPLGLGVSPQIFSGQSAGQVM
jgi:hypothetical protein